MPAQLSAKPARVLSLIALVVMALALAGASAISQARAFQTRGTTQPAAPVHYAAALRVGVNASLEQYDPAALDALLADLSSRGVKYIRQEFKWAELEPKQGAADWSAPDRIFAAARKHGIQILAVLLTTPEWARGASGNAQAPATQTAPPQDPSAFASFAKAFATRYDPGVMAYQIWDEPNLSAAWGNGLINPSAYLALLKQTRAAIREASPNAITLLAGLAPTVEQSEVNLAPQIYLRELYELGGKDFFDVAAAKPYGFDIPPDDRRVDAGVLNFSHVILMREEMARNGDADKAIWLTQFGWNAQLPNWKGEASPWSGVSEAAQADYTRSAIARVAGEWSWAGAMFVRAAQPAAPAASAEWGFALYDQSGQPRPVLQSLTDALAALKSGAMPAPRAQLFAVCDGAANCAPNPAAQFSPEWRFSNLGADIPQREDARVTFTFTGDSLALIVRRGDYRAYSFVQVDGKPANLLPSETGPNGRGAYLIMTSPDLAPRVETVPVASGLGAGVHTAQVFVDRGWNQWALIGWAPSASAASALPSWLGMALLALSGLCAVVFVGLFRFARWADGMRGLQKRASPPALVAVAAALGTWLAAWLSWAQDAATAYRNLGLPANVIISGAASGVLFWSPALVVSLIALAVLFVLVLLRLEVGLMLLAFFIPFYLIPQRLFASAFSMVELLTLMCLVSFALKNLTGLRRPVRFGFTLLDAGVLLLVLVSFASAMQAQYRVEAFREVRVVIAESAAVYLILRASSLNRDQLRLILGGFLAGAVAVAGIGLFNYARGIRFAAEGGLPRIRSVYGSPNNDSLFLGRAWPLLVVYTLASFKNLTGLRKSVRFILLLALALVTFALALTQSRGALLLGLPASVLAMCFAAGGKWRRVGGGLLGAGAIGLMLLFSGALNPLLRGTRLANALDLVNGTGFFRINLWQSAWEMFRDHPLFGVGPDNFLYAYRGFYITPAAWQEPNLSHAHNFFFDTLARLGAAGVAAWGVLLAGLAINLRKLLKIDRWLGVAMVGLFADVFAHGFVDNSFFLVDLAFVFMLACGIVSRIVSGDRGNT